MARKCIFPVQETLPDFFYIYIHCVSVVDEKLSGKSFKNEENLNKNIQGELGGQTGPSKSSTVIVRSNDSRAVGEIMGFFSNKLHEDIHVVATPL